MLNAHRSAWNTINLLEVLGIWNRERNCTANHEAGRRNLPSSEEQRKDLIRRHDNRNIIIRRESGAVIGFTRESAIIDGKQSLFTNDWAASNNNDILLRLLIPRRWHYICLSDKDRVSLTFSRFSCDPQKILALCANLGFFSINWTRLSLLNDSV